MATLGFIGSGNIGSTLARLAIGQGHDVVMSNSRGPDTLADLVADLGPHAAAATAEDAAAAADIAVVTIPLKNIDQVPVDPLRGKVVIDTNNYYPQRDGTIADLDDESTTVSEMLQAHLPDSQVVKAFNHIMASDLGSQGQPVGSPGRRALIVAGDDAGARSRVASLIGTFGYDVLDIGPLAEGWRIQRDTPGYVGRFTTEELAEKVQEARRYADTDD